MKKSIPYKISLILFFTLGVINLNAQNVINIINLNGVEKTITLNTLSKITFSGTNMIFNYQNGTNESMAFSTINKMLFATPTVLNDIKIEDKMILYPNPASDKLYLKNVNDENLNISIFSISGLQLLKITALKSSEPIDISSLPKGFFVLKINDQAIKFTKK